MNSPSREDAARASNCSAVTHLANTFAMASLSSPIVASTILVDALIGSDMLLMGILKDEGLYPKFDGQRSGQDVLNL